MLPIRFISIDAALEHLFFLCFSLFPHYTLCKKVTMDRLHLKRGVIHFLQVECLHGLLGFFSCMGHLSSLHCWFIKSLIYNQYGLMNTYFICWFVIQNYFICFDVQMFKLWPWETPLIYFHCVCLCVCECVCLCVCVLKHLLYGSIRYHELIFYSCLSPKISPGHVSWKVVLETKIWVLDFLISIGVLFILDDRKATIKLCVYQALYHMFL